MAESTGPIQLPSQQNLRLIHNEDLPNLHPYISMGPQNCSCFQNPNCQCGVSKALRGPQGLKNSEGIQGPIQDSVVAILVIAEPHYKMSPRIPNSPQAKTKTSNTKKPKPTPRISKGAESQDIKFPSPELATIEACQTFFRMPQVHICVTI